MEQMKILVVDDDTAVADLIKFRLTRDAADFSVSVVEGGMECIEYLESNQVDCIISDYQMPGMNGIELLRSLRRLGNDEGARILGIARCDDAVGMRHSEVLPPDEQMNIDHVRRAVRSGYWLREEEICTRDAQRGTRRVLSTFNGIVEQGHLVRAWRVVRELLN